jgi:hypothetical protein
MASLPGSRRLVALLVLSLASFAAPLRAQIPPGYYAGVDATNATTLRATLHDAIDDHTAFPYTSGGTDTWDILEEAMEDPNDPGAILDVYRNRSFPKQGGGNSFYDREHTWPSSLGFPDEGSGNLPYSDCHMLWLADSGYNGARSNKPFRTCATGCSEYVTDVEDGQGGGAGSYPGQSNWSTGVNAAGTWEVWAGRRGDVARALLYADIRYEGGNHGVTFATEPQLVLTDVQALIAASNTGNNELVAYMGELSVLLLWHAQDPVDDWERNRNDVVWSHQGNRNPFVDHPEWVSCLFEGSCGGGDVTPPATVTGLVATAGDTTLSLDWNDNIEPDLAGYTVSRATVPGGPYLPIHGGLLSTSDTTDTGLTNGTTYYYVATASDTSTNESGPSSEASATPMAGLGDPPGSDPWINEFHYDNAGTDTGEMIEVAGPAGTDLSGWTVVGYNGNGGSSYATFPLSGVLTDQQSGFGTKHVFTGQIQNGGPDGLALVNPQGDVIEFLSYEGTMIASGGPADGMTSTDIGVEETFATPVGFSLQLTGTGSSSGDFSWSSPIPQTGSAVNTGQVFDSPWTDLGFALAGVSGDPSLVGSGPFTDGSTYTVSLTNAAPSAVCGLFVALAAAEIPFKGGTLVPWPLLDVIILGTDPSGELELMGVTPPALPPGLDAVMQYWIADGAAIHGASASNGLMVTTP